MSPKVYQIFGVHVQIFYKFSNFGSYRIFRKTSETKWLEVYTMNKYLCFIPARGTLYSKFTVLAVGALAVFEKKKLNLLLRSQEVDDTSWGRKVRRLTTWRREYRHSVFDERYLLLSSFICLSRYVAHSRISELRNAGNVMENMRCNDL